ncbi:MAG: 3-hydroxyacyl-CoA dehydrogenase NAD-binding domain-containing protein [Candidatus Thermoplasmatota archaeon]|jgi:3-hydroxybutyryl-CoA dehydrogenase|nr:3-hydroxyacyl-CoA dehydrogenase NAD-binding domain-containing protein [Candidatus Thermoplasmatota archaeon]MCL5785814.1 3-hydroxyacyl-CoA dehydrogenase NAD-binding domain-containing protein [Candidatus Thermoplasmatota archaeon]
MNPSDVTKVGVIGSGVMGHGIAMSFARYGFPTVMYDISEDLLKKGLESISSGKFGLQRLVSKGTITEDKKNEIIGRISITTKLSDLKDCGLVVEAAPEIRSLKAKLFSELDSICGQDAIFASNTSGIMISELASSTRRGDRFVGMHWFNPPQVMKLVEVVRGPETSDSTLEVIRSVSGAMEKVPIVVNDGPGFFTTRFINSWLMEAYRIFEQGIAGIKEIDQMSKLAFGFPMGPFELSDLIGLDTMLHVADYMFEETKDRAYSAPTVLKRLVLAGYLGKKAGSKGGWYDYYGIQADRNQK